MTFRHLANMVGGYARAESPGNAWAYNDFGIQLYARTLELVFGSDLNAAALSRLGDLDFEDDELFGSRDGLGMIASIRDYARIGLLWLNRGNWDGLTVLPSDFFDRYRRPFVPRHLPGSAAGGSDYLGIGSFGGGSNDMPHGPGVYGYNWWFNSLDDTYRQFWPDAPPDTFQANGHWGEEVVIVIPSLGIVVSADGDWGNKPEFEPGEKNAKMNRALELVTESAMDYVATENRVEVVSENESYLKYSDGSPYFLCGAGEPEDFLYLGERNQDGTRSGGNQLELIKKIAGTGANSMYFMFVLSHGGDGRSDHNPFLNSDPSQGLDENILEQWETWFSAMDLAGLTLFAFIYDDGSSPFGGGDAVPSGERDFLEQVVGRFKHHRNIIWVMAEEHLDAFSVQRIKNMAAVVRAADDRVHPIAVHKQVTVWFDEFADDQNIDQFAMQLGDRDVAGIHDNVVRAVKDRAAGRYNVHMAEIWREHGTTPETRRKNWAIAMGGAYVSVFGWDIETTSVADLEDCGVLRRFFESTNFNEMIPSDSLALAGTDYVLAQVGSSYILYAYDLVGEMGVSGLPAGTYDLTWLDIANRTYVDQIEVTTGGGDVAFSPPAGLGTELAVYLRSR